MANGTKLSDDIQVTHLISAFDYQFPDNFHYDGEKHPGWEFVYVNRGKIKIQADRLTYVLKSGEMVCHKPLEFHSVEPFGGTASVTIFCFVCDGEQMQYFNNKIVLIAPRQKQYLRDIAGQAARVFYPKDPLLIARDGQMDRRADADPAAEQYIKNTIELLILSLMTAESTDRRRRSEFYEMTTRRQTLTDDIIRYLQENISEPIKLSDLSRRFSYSLSSIKRIFKQETGSGVTEYLNDMRIERAKVLLCDTEEPIGNIAQQLGFGNIYYFSNTFRKKTSFSPSEYRHLHHR